MSTKKEEFLRAWTDAVEKSGQDVSADVVQRLGSELWTGREINYAVVDNDGFNLLAHRYFHGVGSLRLQLLLTRIPVQFAAALPFIVGDYMFALGFMCGVANERGWDVDEVAPVEEAAECLKMNEQIPFMKSLRLPTREELDQEDALPSLFATAEEESLPEDFAPVPPPDNPPEDVGGGGGYH